MNETDIHYLVGLLYLVAHTDRISVTLGSKVRDDSSETNRDVDIVVAEAGRIGLIAAEVKNEKRPLDIIHVEQLCAKLNDMSSLDERYVVSASGYTAPAIKKAHKHGLRCLKLVDGRVPAFPTVDISKLEHMSLGHHSWLNPPRVSFRPKDELPQTYEAFLNDSSLITWTSLSGTSRTLTAKELADITARTMKGWQVPPISGEHSVQVFIPFDRHSAVLHLNDKHFGLAGVLVDGTVKVTHERLPLNQSRYLEDEHGAVFAGAAVVEWRGALTGIAVSERNSEIGAFYLPESLRRIRPVDFELSK